MPATQGVKLDPEIRERLKALGRLRDRSPHWLMRAAIESYLEREEHIEREKQEDMRRWQAYQLTGNSVSHETAAAWLSDLAAGKAAPCPD